MRLDELKVGDKIILNWKKQKFNWEYADEISNSLPFEIVAKYRISSKHKNWFTPRLSQKEPDRDMKIEEHGFLVIPVNKSKNMTELEWISQRESGKNPWPLLLSSSTIMAVKILPYIQVDNELLDIIL